MHSETRGGGFVDDARTRRVASIFPTRTLRGVYRSRHDSVIITITSSAVAHRGGPPVGHMCTWMEWIDGKVRGWLIVEISAEQRQRTVLSACRTGCILTVRHALANAMHLFSMNMD